MSSPLKRLGTRMRQVPKISFTKGTISNMKDDITKRESVNLPILATKKEYIRRYLDEEEKMSKQALDHLDSLEYYVGAITSIYERMGDYDWRYPQIIDQELSLIHI